MPSEILVNSLGLTYKGTVGISTATLPDVCKTPSPGGPVPIPYPNIAQQSSLADGSTTVKAKGQMIAIKPSNYSRSNGDEPGTLGGVTSNTNMKEATWITWSFDVKMDGGNACRHTDKMFQNHKNTADLSGNIDPAAAGSAEADVRCAIQKCDQKDEDGNDYDVTYTAAPTPTPTKMPKGSQCSALGSKKHTCVRKTLEAKKKPQMKCEQTFDMNHTPPLEHPRGSPQLPAGQGRRPDVVVGGPAPGASYDVYDAKFPCSAAVKAGKTSGSMPSDMGKTGDSKMSRTQRTAYEDISNGGDVKALSPADCASQPCDDGAGGGA